MHIISAVVSLGNDRIIDGGINRFGRNGAYTSRYGIIGKVVLIIPSDTDIRYGHISQRKGIRYIPCTGISIDIFICIIGIEITDIVTEIKGSRSQINIAVRNELIRRNALRTIGNCRFSIIDPVDTSKIEDKII